jgi:predicted PurR-regulated permease PerM
MFKYYFGFYVNMLDKRGLSDVVTTVLIVLVALGAIGIIAGFLLPAVQQGSSQITSTCLTLQLEPTKCTIDEVTNQPTVLVKRNTGDATLNEVRVIFTDTNGETTSEVMSETPGILETKSFSGTAVSPTEVRVAGVVTTEGGEEKICGESVVEVCK